MRYASTKQLKVKAQKILDKHFDKAARDAESALKPLMEAALANLRKHFDVDWVEEMMGMTVVSFKGRHTGCSLGYFSPSRDAVDPHYCSRQALAAIEEFEAIAALVGDYRTAYCLYGRLS